MIAIDTKNTLVRLSVLGEFTLADFKQFEEHILYGVKFGGEVNLLIDLRDMLSYSLDVMWEELKFSKAHQWEFGKVAVVTGSQWIAWSAWLQRFLVEADIEVFSDLDPALAWLDEA